MPKMEDPAARLERYLEQRRLDLDMEWTDVAKAAGIPTETLLQVRRGGLGANRSLTRKAVEDAVGWSTGDIEKVRAGGEPTIRAGLVAGLPVAATLGAMATGSSDADQAIADAITAHPSLPPRAKRHLLDQVQLLLMIPPAESLDPQVSEISQARTRGVTPHPDSSPWQSAVARTQKPKSRRPKGSVPPDQGGDQDEE